LHVTLSGDNGQASPPFAAEVVTEYDRSFIPSPHPSEQAPHSPQAPEQSTRHGLSLHAALSGDDGQALPPFAAEMVTEYDRSFVPPPHVEEHAPQPPQSPTQSTGHGLSLHAALSGDDGQALPPFAAEVVTEYDRSFVPPPHVAEHEPQSPQVPAQSTASGAQSPSLHAALSGDDGQASPPFAAEVVTEYDRSFVPSSHPSEHACQSPQAPAQSTGHGLSLHAALSGDEGQALPPFAAEMVTEYDRSFVPPPHVAEHEPQPPQSPTQSTRHGVLLQGVLSGDEGQALPPFAAEVVTEYDRSFVPPPQAAEHEPQPPQSPAQFTAVGAATAPTVSVNSLPSETVPCCAANATRIVMVCPAASAGTLRVAEPDVVRELAQPRPVAPENVPSEVSSKC
jgi:sulfur carrier protein ThiS